MDNKAKLIKFISTLIAIDVVIGVALFILGIWFFFNAEILKLWIISVVIFSVLFATVALIKAEEQ